MRATTDRTGRRGAARVVAAGCAMALGAVALLAGCLPDTKKIDARLTQAVQPATPPATGCAESCGITLKVTSRNAAGTETPEFTKSYGTYKGTEVVPIASSSKWLMSAVVMTQVDAGKLSTSSTVGQWFPAYVGTQKGSITLAQLLSHTSGMAWDAASCLGDQSVTLAACADSILALPLKAAPGTQFAYGGNSMQVAGRMAELASGKGWVDLAKSLIFTPLGMKDTTFFGQNPQVAGGAFSTVADYDRFLAAIQNRGALGSTRVLSTSAVTQMETDRIAGLTIAYTPNSATHGYGLGVWLDPEPAGMVVASPGKFGAFPMIDRGHCYRSMLLQFGSYLDAVSQMNVIHPELDRQLHC